MLLVILLTNVLIRKTEMMKVTQKEKKTYKYKRTTKKVFKKSLCTKEDISSLDEDEVGDSETERVLFMAVEDYDKEVSEEVEEEYEEVEEEIEEVEVDY
jgi:hypothetical protein